MGSKIVENRPRDWKRQALALLPYVDHTKRCPTCGFEGIAPGYDGDAYDEWSDKWCASCHCEFCNQCVPFEREDKDTEFFCQSCMTTTTNKKRKK